MLLPAFVLPLLLAATPPALPSVDRTVLAMGTELRIHFEGPHHLAQATVAALAEETRIEAACSTWDPASDWSRLNAAQGQPVALAPEWLALLGSVQAWSHATEGAFDPVLGALVQAWGLRRGGPSPTSETLAQARQAAGVRLLLLDPAKGTAQLQHARAGLEEGGFLKGYALDAMRRVSGTPAGWLDFGGQLLAWGKPLTVEVADPVDRRRSSLSLSLQDASLSCSGTSERGRHILNPHTGLPSPAWGSTAVVAADGLTADVLSTALYVMGPEQGLVWADHHGVAAAFLLKGGSVRMSAAFRALNPTTLNTEPQ